MSEEDYKEIYQKSPRPGLVYGTAKLHKLKENDTVGSLPLRPVISNVGTATYKTAKYLAALLSPLTSSEYNIKNSYEFVKSIKNTKIPNGYKMISLDGKNLFTNVPLDKTIKIILRKIYQERMLDTNIPQKEMEKLLHLYTKHVHFSYGGRIYIQVDAVAMGSPLGPVLANIFMTELEIDMIPLLGNYLQNWKRFVDDTFAFVLPDKIKYIRNQLNAFDENIQFTFEKEEENKLAFLDEMVIRNTNDTINTTVYQKPTNTDIYINWNSHSPLHWKKTTANILIHRAIKICSDKKLLDEELDITKHHLCEVNEYPRKFVKNIINDNLYKRNSIAAKLNERKNRKEIIINLKYAGQKGEQLMSKMKKIICNSSEDGAKSKLVYNSAKLGQYFNVNDPAPQKYKSDLVYKFTCPQINCNESYIGETERRFEEHIIDHNKRDKKSHIYKHSSENSHPHVWLDNFKIVGRNYGNRIKRKIGEALLINELKPSLNKQDKSLPLKLFN